METTREKAETILVVDDNPMTLRLLTEILKSEYAVLAAASGEEAMAEIDRAEAIDLILLDIMMPGQNGFEALQTIKELPKTKDTPVIFQTAMGKESDEAKGFAAGVTDYIIKPISRLRLLARVRNQLEIRRQQRLLEEKNKELEEAMELISTLNGILPICSFCKQIRDDEGYWQRVDDYISQHSQAQFSHSVCPACMKENYPDVDLDG